MIMKEAGGLGRIARRPSDEGMRTQVNADSIITTSQRRNKPITMHTKLCGQNPVLGKPAKPRRINSPGNISPKQANTILDKGALTIC